MHMKKRRVSKSRSELNLSENLWIEQNFQKRECIKFVCQEGLMGATRRCVCGREKSNHPVVPEGVIRVTYPAEKWNINKHTEVSPTDAYGTIEFQGGPHPTKAQYIRLSYDTKPEKILTLLQQSWGLSSPNLLISVHGGIANFDLQPKLRRVWRQGLLRAAKTTGAWIVTGGTNTGVMKHVGDALGDTLVQCRNNIVTLGIVPWGIVHNREELIRQDGNVSFHAMAASNGNNVVLNNNHSYFLLSDDGTVGRAGFEAILRKKLEKYISQQISTRSRGKDFTTPVVYLILEGGCNTIRVVLDCVMEDPPFPVVVIDGSGRAADLLAFTHKYANDDGTMPEALRDQLLLTIKKTFGCSTEASEKTFIELMMCMKNRKHLITIFRIQEQAQDIDQAILAALLKSQNASAPDQLSRALAWDRVDIAQSHIFVYGQEWPEGAMEQAMMDALAHNRVDFVKLLIENGVNMSKWLTIERLEELYNLGLMSSKSQPVKGMFASTRHHNDASITLKHLLKEIKMHVPSDYRYTLLDIGQVINRLMSGSYRSTYCRRRFRITYNSVMNKGSIIGKVINSTPAIDPLPPINNTFRYPYSELMVWAVLLHRQKMARFMWERGEEALAKALLACNLYKSLAREAEEDELEVDVANELRRYSQEFANLANELLEHCFKTDDDLTQLLLTYELANWSDQTCMSLATSARHRPFIASTGCQIVVTEMWMGGLRTRKYANLKVILGIIFFPLILFMNYRSVEELQLMPQTVEEHFQDLNGSDSDSSSDTDSDTDSISSRRSAQSERRPRDSVLQQVSMNSQNSAAVSQQNTEIPPPLDVFVLQQRQSSLRLGKKIYEFYTAPITKFWMHAIGYAVFMVAFIYLCLIRTPLTPSFIEWYIISYMAGWALEKIREFAYSEAVNVRQKMRVYVTDFWNLFDMLILVFFFIGVTLRFLHGFLSHSRAFYCLSVGLCITRILDLFAVSQHLGPFVHIIGKMMVELLYFVVFLLIALTAFGTFRQSLWFPYEDFQWSLVREIFLKPYFMLYGEVYADEIWPDCDVTPEGAVKPDFPCVPGRWLVPAAMSIFLIIGIILLLSVLIAVFNSVFNRNYIHSNQVWKYQRYLLVIEYESKPILPSPLIILCHLYVLAKYLRRKWLNKKKLLDNGLKCFLDEHAVERLHDFEEECMEIYYREKETKDALSIDSRLKVTVEKLESINLRIDDIHQKENSIRTCLGVLESHMLALEDVTLHTMHVLSDFQRSMLTQEKPARLASEVCSSMTGRFPFGAALQGDGLPVVGDGRHFTTFNEKKLGPFTEYKKFPSCQRFIPNGQYLFNHSVLFPGNSASQFRQAFRRRDCLPRRTRHNSCSASLQTHASDDRVTSNLFQRSDLRVRFSADTEKPSDHDPMLIQSSLYDVTFPKIRDTQNSLAGMTARKVGDIQNGSQVRSSLHPSNLGPGFPYIGLTSGLPGKLSLHLSPLSPIITPVRAEYTSITDDIDTSSVNRRSPPSTPKMHRWPNADNKRKKSGGRKRKKALPNDQLKKAEETVHKQMEFIVHKRIRQLSLTETESTGNLAKHALESLVDGSEEEEENEIQLAHHSDDEAMSGAQSTVKSVESLKPIKSDPVLLKNQQNDVYVTTESEFEVVCVNENNGGEIVSERISSNAAQSIQSGDKKSSAEVIHSEIAPRRSSAGAVTFSVKDDGRRSPVVTL